jgi:hypothetical protein
MIAIPIVHFDGTLMPICRIQSMAMPVRTMNPHPIKLSISAMVSFRVFGGMDVFDVFDVNCIVIYSFPLSLVD